MLSISLVAEEVFMIGNFPVTNSLLTMWLGMIITIILVITTMSRARLVPKGFQLILESVYTFFLGLCENVLEDKKMALRAVPFIATIFIFVFAANIFEIIPGVGTIGWVESKHHVKAPLEDAHTTEEESHEKTIIPFFRPTSADLNMPLALALISMATVQIVGLKTLGIRYLKKFFNFSNPLNFIVGIFELISEVAKIISFTFRLFGNIFAGKVLLVVMLMLVPWIIPVPFYGLELFVSFIQAFVFAMLTLVFIKVAMTPHGEGEH